jgi:peptidyl-prolyl cis-trans isomerase SurA
MRGIQSWWRGFLPFALVGLMAGPCFAAQTCNRVVAIVNNQVITLYELNNRIKEMTGHSAEDLRARDESQFLDARRRILDLLIDERITEEKIKELKISVSDRQVDAAIEKIKQDNQFTQEDLLARLERDGLTYAKYRQRIKNELERSQLIEYEVRSKILISDEDISRYYVEHESSFATGEEVHLASIFLLRKNPKDPGEREELNKRGQEILTKLRAGEDFSELARRFSQGPGADEGGDLGTFRWDQLDPEAKKILEGVPEGGFSDLIFRDNGVQIIKVVERQGGRRRPLEEVKEAIYDILYREEVNTRYQSWLKGLRESSYTKIIF